MSTMDCDIVSAEGEIFHGRVTMVVASGEMGELGITPRHTPLITRLKPGQVRLKLENGDEQCFYVSGGILEVQPKIVSVLADTVIRAKDLDEAQVRAAIDAAQRALAGQDVKMSIEQAQMQLMMGKAQLEALEHLRRTLKH